MSGNRHFRPPTYRSPLATPRKRSCANGRMAQVLSSALCSGPLCKNQNSYESSPACRFLPGRIRRTCSVAKLSALVGVKCRSPRNGGTMARKYRPFVPIYTMKQCAERTAAAWPGQPVWFFSRAYDAERSAKCTLIMTACSYRGPKIVLAQRCLRPVCIEAAVPPAAALNTPCRTARTEARLKLQR